MKAGECKCIKCGKQAVAFWPVFDPDVPAEPYCRECLDKEKFRMKREIVKIMDVKDKKNKKKIKFVRLNCPGRIPEKQNKQRAYVYSI